MIIVELTVTATLLRLFLKWERKIQVLGEGAEAEEKDLRKLQRSDLLSDPGQFKLLLAVCSIQMLEAWWSAYVNQKYSTKVKTVNGWVKLMQKAFSL